MDLVTKANFDAAAAAFEDGLKSCTFCAFDCEMTGIMLDGTGPHITDTLARRYAKMCKVVGEYSLMQMGLCLFHEAEDGGLTATPYTFYVMPDAKSRTKLIMGSDTAVRAERRTARRAS